MYMQLEYTFEEVAITLNGQDCFASGILTVDFYEEPEDRSTGYRGGAVITDFPHIRGTVTDEDGELVLVLKNDNDAVKKQILDRIDESHIVEACDEWLSEG